MKFAFIQMMFATSRCWATSYISVTGMALLIILASCQSTQHEADDYAESGHYHLLYCQTNRSSSQAAYLSFFLPYVFSKVQTVLNDLKQGTNSNRGYKAFFKTNDNLEAVRNVFQNMIDGPDVLSAPGGNLSQNAQWTPPTFICANDGQNDTIRLYERCKGNPHPVMYVEKNSGFVTICPIFWQLPRIPHKESCPKVARNQFTTNGWLLASNQYAITVHELVHLFNRHDVMKSEVYDLRDAFDLNATRSLENAQTFGYYAACMY